MATAVDPPGRSCKDVGPPDAVDSSSDSGGCGGGGGEECKDLSGGREEEGEGVDPSDSGWRRSVDKAAGFLITTGTTTSSYASNVSRTTGTANTR